MSYLVKFLECGDEETEIFGTKEEALIFIELRLNSEQSCCFQLFKEIELNFTAEEVK